MNVTVVPPPKPFGMFIPSASAVTSASSMIRGVVVGVKSRSDRSVLNVISGRSGYGWRVANSRCVTVSHVIVF